MSKGRGIPRSVPNLNPASMQKQLQELQQKMLQAQEALATETVTATAGGGAVTVVMNGQQKAVQVKISPEVIQEGDSPLDIEMLQDLVLSAINEAIEKSQQLAATRMGAATGGLGLGLPDLT